MSQTELMLRLIKNKKIVGYELHDCENECIWHSKNVDAREWGEDIFHNGDFDEFYIEHDSFELCIKDGDELWFEGDKLKWVDRDGNVHEGIIEYQDIEGWLVYEKEITGLWGLYEDVMEGNPECIGTIYDGRPNRRR